MKPVFVGNFGFDTRQAELDRLFSKYGRVDRVDVKSGYAFVYFEDERDAEDAIHALDNYPFGYDRRKLSVEWARGERGRGRDAPKGSNQRPTKTLFVIHFDAIRTRVKDLERHFEPYGKLLSVRIRKNFAFVQFETQDSATEALKCTNDSKLLDRVISVEYSLRDDDERDDRDGSLGRGYGRSPYRRSPSPRYRNSRPSPDYGRSRPSPDYGRPQSPIYGRPRSRSPNYGRPLSPVYGRPLSPVYGRPQSPVYGRPSSFAYDQHDVPAYERRRSPVLDRIHSRSPIRRSSRT